MGQSPAAAQELTSKAQTGQQSATSSSSKAPAPTSNGTAITKATRNGFKPKEYAQDYLSKHVGSSPRSGQTRSLHSQVLEDRARAAMRNSCCHFQFMHSCGSDSGLKNAHGKPQSTDCASLLDVNGDGIECGEVTRAVCMVNPEIDDEVATREGTDSLEVRRMRGAEDEEVKVPKSLVVPSVFKHIGYDWAAPSSSQALATAIQQESLEQCMKPFIQSMLTGVLIKLRLEAAEAISDTAAKSIDAVVSFDDSIAHILVTAGRKERSVPIKAIRWVRPPEQGQDSDKCVDIRLSGGYFLRFLFNTQTQAKYFGTCMRLLVKTTRSDPTVGARVA